MFLTCESHQHGVVYESLKCHIFFLSKGLVSLNQKENAMLHRTHMCNVIDTVKTLSQKLKALLRLILNLTGSANNYFGKKKTVSTGAS